MNSPAPAFAHKVAVYIGRFQPFHNGHLALLQRALGLGERVVVVLGSSFQARSPKNPFNWEERAAMIRLALPAEVRDRLHFVPVRDYYSDEDWVAAVQAGVAEHCEGSRDIGLVGHFKDASSYYLDRFPGWTLHSCEREGAVDATGLRQALFEAGTDEVAAGLELVALHIPKPVVAFLRSWAQLPYFPRLCRENAKLRKNRKAWAGSPFEPIFVTVDSVVTCADKVLLVVRGGETGEGLYALPGGFLEPDERLLQGAMRELREETTLGLLDSQLETCFRGVAVFDHPERSLRGRTITHAHRFALGGDRLPPVLGADDAVSAVWMDIDQLVTLEDRFFEDHFHILNHFLKLVKRESDR